MKNHNIRFGGIEFQVSKEVGILEDLMSEIKMTSMPKNKSNIVSLSAYMTHIGIVNEASHVPEEGVNGNCKESSGQRAALHHPRDNPEEESRHRRAIITIGRDVLVDQLGVVEQASRESKKSKGSKEPRMTKTRKSSLNIEERDDRDVVKLVKRRWSRSRRRRYRRSQLS